MPLRPDEIAEVEAIVRKAIAASSLQVVPPMPVEDEPETEAVAAKVTKKVKNV